MYMVYNVGKESFFANSGGFSEIVWDTVHEFDNYFRLSRVFAEHLAFV